MRLFFYASTSIFDRAVAAMGAVIIEQKGITAALVGCNTPEQVAENVKALNSFYDTNIIIEIDQLLNS
jgi:aryl-alcohol dehydrogenase-like predicted oxidoreductase